MMNTQQPGPVLTTRAPTRNVVAIDPGLRHAGVAVFHGGLLVHSAVEKTAPRAALVADVPWVLRSAQQFWATYWDHHALPWGNDAGWTLVVEGQTAYGDATNTADRRDVVALAYAASVALMSYPLGRPNAPWLMNPAPGRWKGQIKKEAHHTQALDQLLPHEARHVATDHNARDAVCLGLWALGRLL